MKTDAQLKTDVTSELESDPSINASAIGVAVKDGVVTVSGHLDTYAEKVALESAVVRVAGVKAVAIEVDVKLDPHHRRSDSEIAAAAEAALRWHSKVPDDRIVVKVEKGWITLSGEVDWDFQRSYAERAVRPLIGVVGVSNVIRLKPGAVPANVAARIRDALARHALREAKHIDIGVNGSVVTLRGKVDSWSERNAVCGAAWAAPGVSSVVNELRIES